MPSTNVDSMHGSFSNLRRSSNPQVSMNANALGHHSLPALSQTSMIQYTSQETREISFQQPPYPLQRHPHSSDMADASSVHPHSFSSGIDPLDTERQQRQQRRRISSSSSVGSKRVSLTTSSGNIGSNNSQSHQSSNLRFKATNTPHHTRRFTRLISDDEPDTTYLWGYLLFFCTMIGFIVSMYALVVSTYMPETKNPILDWIKHDSHYCMLVPVTLPVTILAVLFNWLGMKLFRHN